MNSICECGKGKDKRAKRCRDCFIASVKDIDTKECNVCHLVLPIDKFNTRVNGRGGTKIRPGCKECEAQKASEFRKANPQKWKEYKRAWAKNNPDAAIRYSVRASAKHLGLDVDEVLAYYDSHNGECDICHKPPVTYRRLSVEHCHEKNVFRGLLCSKCNFLIGLAKDDISILESAIEYLKK